MTQEQYSLIIGEMFLVVTHDNILNALKNAIPEKEDDIQDISEKLDMLSKYVEGKIREYAMKKVLDLMEQEKKNEHIHKRT